MAKVDSKNPPKFEDDFKRLGFAENLFTVLQKGTGMSPVLLDGDWGVGKTTFIKKFIQLVKEQEENAPIIVYVDAFSADHGDEALLPIIAAILESQPTDESNEIISKAIPVLRFGLKAVTRGLVAHLVRQDAGAMEQEFNEAIQDASSKAIDSTISSLLDAHKNSTDSINELSDIIEEIAGDNGLYIVIDELDRCRPDFAIEVLEVTKHIFEIHNVKIILVANSNQLAASVSHRYGELIDGRRYLEKFLALQISLPENIQNALPRSRWENASERHFLGLIDDSEILNKTTLNEAWSKSLSKIIIERNRLSLREVERVIARLEAIHVFFDWFHEKRYYVFKFIPLVAVFLVAIKPDLKGQIVNKNIEGLTQFAEFLGVESLNSPSFDKRPHEVEILVYKLLQDYGFPNNDLLQKPLPEGVIDYWERYSRELFEPLFDTNGLDMLNQYLDASDLKFTSQDIENI